MLLHSKPSPITPMFMTFLAGAALGAVVMALTTPKTGPQLRRDLRSLANRARRRAQTAVEEAGETWDEMKDCAHLAADEDAAGAPLPAPGQSV